MESVGRESNFEVFSISDLIRKVADSTCDISCYLNGGTFCLVDMDISPVDFLCQAEEDFARGGLSASVNCISNSKRAIIGQVDQVLLSFGYECRRWDTERKLNKLKELGLLAPTVLRKLVDARNLLEHEYKSPSAEQIEDYLDIAAIFVLGVSSQFHPFSDEISINFTRENKLVGGLDFGIEKRRLEGRVMYSAYGYVYDSEFKRSMVGEAFVANGSKLFSALVKACSCLELKYKYEDAVAKLTQKIKAALVGQQP